MEKRMAVPTGKDAVIEFVKAMFRSKEGERFAIGIGHPENEFKPTVILQTGDIYLALDLRQSRWVADKLQEMVEEFSKSEMKMTRDQQAVWDTLPQVIEGIRDAANAAEKRYSPQALN